MGSLEIVRWFLRHPDRGLPQVRDLYVARKRLVGYKDFRCAGWPLPHGSTVWVDGADGGDFVAASITSVGDLLVGSTVSTRSGDGELNALALQTLANLCGLTQSYIAKDIPPTTDRPYDANEVLRITEQMKAKWGPRLSRYRTSEWIDAT
jgi:hypothetical protein